LKAEEDSAKAAAELKKLRNLADPVGIRGAPGQRWGVTRGKYGNIMWVWINTY
jgi:hypothetical protein